MAPKNIVLLSDGTGNSAAKHFKTNVWRMYQALDLTGSDQIALYDDGVGTSSFKPWALVTGAFGWGLKRNVLDLYTYLCRNYKKEDKIYCFGFSRGAFTIRVLTALIDTQGLVPFNSSEQLEWEAKEVFREYRRRYRADDRFWKGARGTRDFVERRLRSKKDEKRTKDRHRPKIEFVGLWDTVAAYGLPFEELTRAWDRWIWPIVVPNQKISSSIKRACHALSLDDERETFHPVLWDESDLEKSDSLLSEQFSQVWFAGVHSNVGGGYPDDSLAYVSLEWIMTEASGKGLKLKDDAIKKAHDKANVFGKIYDSRQGISILYRYGPRSLGLLKAGGTLDPPKIHESVITRIRGDKAGYAPVIVPAKYAVATTSGKILTREQVKLEPPGQAEARVAGQTSVWTRVRERRWLYGLALVAIAATGVLPFLPGLRRDGICESPLCFLDPPLRLLRAVLPDFAAPWLETFATNPIWLVAALVTASLLLGRSAVIKSAIAGDMQELWLKSTHGKFPAATEPAAPTRTYRSAGGPLRDVILPDAALLLIFLLVAFIAYRSTLSVSDSVGWTCDGLGRPAELGETQRFDPNDICFPTGFTLDEGHRYEISIVITEGWSDDSIKTGPSGFPTSREHPQMILGVPFRRHLTEPWFRLMARVGRTGADEFPLELEPREPRDGKQVYVGHIHARRDGELFLFVNDVVVPWPGSMDAFYLNNHGSADVTVREARM